VAFVVFSLFGAGLLGFGITQLIPNDSSSEENLTDASEPAAIPEPNVGETPEFPQKGNVITSSGTTITSSGTTINP